MDRNIQSLGTKDVVGRDMDNDCSARLTFQIIEFECS